MGESFFSEEGLVGVAGTSSKFSSKVKRKFSSKVSKGGVGESFFFKEELVGVRRAVCVGRVCAADRYRYL